MTPFESFASKAVPLPIDNVDTDVITPIGRVLEGAEALVRYAFESLRFAPDGSLRRDCPFNDPAYAGARILIGGENFGCGSSRETAVWALAGMGFSAVIAPSFGGIFFSNCFKNGVLPIVLAAEDVAAVARHAAGGSEILVDLGRQRVSAGALERSFEVPALRKEALLDGLDDLGLILKRQEALAAFETRDRLERPWVYLSPA
ncbi:MAG: 3-isopropylmalate dehydratase small subunit [Caulobacteraceae bacterium]|nr:3-isopropylmalate dehydratase small subunit [Caulobacteraceae bacterium]